MKICWDNLENIKYDNFHKVFRRKSIKLYEKVCKTCKEPFLGRRTSIFCSKKCFRFSEESKQKISKSLYGHIVLDKTKNKLKRYTKNKNSQYKGGYSVCWYDTYASRISFAEEVRRALDNQNILEVKCKYCGKWFKPTRIQIRNRIKYIHGERSSESLFYCSEECKNICPIFHKQKYPMGYISDQSGSREVQPELRKLVLERDTYTCQKCHLSSNTSCVELHCHHINPVILDPLESADMDNCITLCKDCHLEVHQKDGCKTGQLANNEC